MKKFLKVLAAAAAVAAIIPYRGEGDENGGELEGLLWKATWKTDPHYQSEPDINITFGFNNPFKSKESHLFADDLVVDYCCDEELAHDVENEADLYADEELTAEVSADEVIEDIENSDSSEEPTTEDDCSCGE